MWEWFKRVFIGEFNNIETKVNDQITDAVTQANKSIDNMKSSEKIPDKKSKIFESPDGGKTVYSRDVGQKERTLVKKSKKNAKK